MISEKIKKQKLKSYRLTMVFLEMKEVTLTSSKTNFQKITLIYTNQATISTIKGDLAVYSQNFIIGQFIPLQNQPPNLEEYRFKLNGVKLAVPIYNNETGEFVGLKETLAYIMLKDGQGEVFFQMAFSKKSLQFFFVVRKKECLMHSSGQRFENIYQKLSMNLTARNIQNYFSFYPVPLIGKRTLTSI